MPDPWTALESEQVCKKIDRLIESNDMLQRELYLLMRSNNDLRDATSATLAMVVSIFEVLKESQREHNFGFGSAIPKEYS